MNRSCLLIALLTIIGASCSKKQNDLHIQVDTPPVVNDTNKVYVFQPRIDTFKGECCSKLPFYSFTDSAVFFYVSYYKPDSLRITSNAAYAHEEYAGQSTLQPIDIKLMKSPKNSYWKYGDKIVFKKDSIILSWTYYEEMFKGNSGGPHPISVLLWGKNINKKAIFLKPSEL